MGAALLIAEEWILVAVRQITRVPVRTSAYALVPTLFPHRWLCPLFFLGHVGNDGRFSIFDGVEVVLRRFLDVGAG